MNEPEGMITVREAAQRLGRSIEQVRRYLREGRLKGQRIGQQWFVEEASLAAMPLTYGPGKAVTGRLKEAPAIMEFRRETGNEMEALVKAIDASREAIRARLGRDLDVDVAEMVRLDRDEH